MHQVGGRVIISRRASAMSRNRRVGSFCRHRRRSDRTAEGVAGGSTAQSGSVLSTLLSTATVVSPLNTRGRSASRRGPPERPDVRAAVYRLPLRLSGLMYPAVPSNMPSAVRPTEIVGECNGSAPGALPTIAFASPKSRTFTTPSGRI